MPWDSGTFQLLAEEVLGSLQGKRPATGVPFFLYVYDPREEVRCLRSCEALAQAWRGEGFHVDVVYLGQLISGALSGTAYVGDGARRAESRARERVVRELAHPRTGLPGQVGRGLLNGSEGVCPPLASGTQSEAALLLRAGSLYPFVHVSHILNALETQTGRTVVVPFPGSRHPERLETLRFLDETEGSYYRARVIGG